MERDNRVIFTIGGDSTDDSSTTTTTGSTSIPHWNDNSLFLREQTNFYNPWQNGAPPGGDENSRGEVFQNPNNDQQVAGPAFAGSQTRTRVRTLSTMVQANEQSLAHLTDIDGSMGGETTIERGTCCSLNWGKRRILIACAIVQLFSALMISLQAPFYPQEAEKKGATPTEYSFVFAVFELTVFIVTPIIYTLNIHKCNPNGLFMGGIFTAAISSIVFGILDNIVDKKYFIAACAIVRILEALGEAAVVASSFVIVASAFPDSIASTSAVLESFYSLGLISGPLVGSILYTVGGYSLPFIVIGGVLLAALVLNCIILPSSSTNDISQFERIHEPIKSRFSTLFRLLASWETAISAMCIMLGSMSLSYLQATLEPHLRTEFELAQLSVGAILIINGAVYTFTAPFWGLLCEKISQLKLVTFIGVTFLVTGYSLIGPVPIFPFTPTIWLVGTGLVLQGIGLSGIFTSSFISILRNSVYYGLPDSPSTYGLAASLMSSMFSLGGFIGAVLSGVLYDTVGFPKGTLSIILPSMIIMCVLLVYVCTSDREMESFIRFNNSENEPLLAASVTQTHSSTYSEHTPNIPRRGEQIQYGTNGRI